MNSELSRSRRLQLLFTALLTTPAAAFVACVESEALPNPEDASSGPEPSALPDGSPDDAGPPRSDASAAPDAGRCTDSGFCLVPLPTLQPLVALAASSVDDAWTIAEDDLLRWDGTSWKTVLHSFNASFFGVTANHPNDVWVVGDQRVVRYSARDGKPPALREYPGGMQPSDTTTTGFWVTPDSSELWITYAVWGAEPELFRYHEEFAEAGSTLVEDRMTSAGEGFPWASGVERFSVYSVFGFGPDDVYVGGLWCTGPDCATGSKAKRYGAIAHYDGARFTLVSRLGERERVSAIYGTTSPDQSRQLWIWAGIAGEPESSIRLLASRRDGSLDATQYSLPVHTDRGSFSTVRAYWEGCHRIQGSIASSGSAWFTNLCLVYRWNGATLELVPTAFRNLPIGVINGIWASDDDTWLVGATPSAIPELPNIGFAALRRRSP